MNCKIENIIYILENKKTTEQMTEIEKLAIKLSEEHSNLLLKRIYEFLEFDFTKHIALEYYISHLILHNYITKEYVIID